MKYSNNKQSLKEDFILLPKSKYLLKPSIRTIKRVVNYQYTYPLPILIIDLELPPTSIGLFHYSVQGIEDIVYSLFDFKDSVLEREFATAKVLRYHTFENYELYTVPVLHMTFVIIGGDLCEITKGKIEDRLEECSFASIGLNGIIYDLHVNNKDELIKILCSPFPEVHLGDFRIFEKLKRNYVNHFELHFIASKQVVEVPPFSLFEKIEIKRHV